MNIFFEIRMHNKWEGMDIKPKPQELYQVAMEARYEIWRRTKSGVDYLGYQFAPYSELYAEMRKELGKTTDIVNLEFTNRMLNSMQIATRPTESYIYFADANRRKVAYNHNYGIGKLPKREFFNISGKDTEKLSRSLFRRIENRIPR